MSALAALLRRRVAVPRLAGEHLAAVLGLSVLALILFREAVFLGRVFFVRDINMWWFPQAESFVRTVAAGSWPLWDPWRGFGQPLLADPSAAVLYPFTWLHLLVRPWTLYTLFVVFHVLASCFGVYGLALRWGVSRAGAFAAAAVWMLSGPFPALVWLPHHLAGAAWMPWVFLAAERALDAGATRPALVCGAAMAGQILAGSADMVAMTWLGYAAYVASCRLRRGRPGCTSNRRQLAILALAAVVALGLSAAQWWPTLEVAIRSGRSGLPESDRTIWSLHPLALLELILPFSFAELPLLPRHLETLLGFKDPWLRSIYLGVPAIGLAAAAFAHRALPRRGFLLALAVGALLVALGRHAPAYALLVRLLPPLQILRFPVKAMIVAAFAWSLLAGMGWDAWRAEASAAPRWTRRVVVPLALAGALSWTGALLALLGAERLGPLLLLKHEAPSYAALVAPTVARLARGAAAATLILALAVAAGHVAGAMARLRLAAATLALAIVDLLASHWSLNPTAHKQLFLRRPEVLEHLTDDSRVYVYDYSVSTRAQRARSRRRTTDRYTVARMPVGWSPAEGLVLGAHTYLNPPTGARWGVRGSYDLDLLGLYDASLAQLTEFLRETEATPLHLRLLQIGGVTHVLALHDSEAWRDLVPVASIPGFFKEPIRVFRVPRPFARAYAVGEARTAEGEAALAVLADAGFDPTRAVILDASSPGPPSRELIASARVLDSKPDRIRLEADSSGHGYLVLTEAYDRGWRATLDGLPTPVLRANLAFRAVAVPPGRHLVELVYRPAGVLCGAALSAATLLVSLGLAIGARAETRRSASDP